MSIFSFNKQKNPPQDGPNQEPVQEAQEQKGEKIDKIKRAKEIIQQIQTIALELLEKQKYSYISSDVDKIRNGIRDVFTIFFNSPDNPSWFVDQLPRDDFFEGDGHPAHEAIMSFVADFLKNSTMNSSSYGWLVERNPNVFQAFSFLQRNMDDIVKAMES